MENLIKQFEKESGISATIESDLYADGEIYSKEYTEWLEKRIQALSTANVVRQSQQLVCVHPYKDIYQSETECYCEKCGEDLTQAN